MGTTGDFPVQAWVVAFNCEFHRFTFHNLTANISK
jgi:hypothetical protein